MFGRGEEEGARKPCQCPEPKILLNFRPTKAPPQYANSGPEFGEKKSTISYFKGKL